MSCEACRTIPPVIPQGYTPKGTYQTLASLNTYITGPRDASTAIIDIYDIFGLSPQTIQGADILSTRLNALVLVPDFFHGDGAKHEWLPADTEEKMSKLMGFVGSKADIPTNVGVLVEAVKVYRETFSSVKTWGSLGLCWGGKVAVLASGEGTLFTATAQVHPGRLETSDAEKLTIPHLVLASKDEPADAVKGYAGIISKNGHGGLVETYETMWHGWMGARADLDNEESLKEYVRGYAQAAEFFEKYLK
ncbi:dienelactone hydrolase family protein [Aspergillus glaucus CBS 516.65]|uniref:Dienelactone hydrolase domain-containing protein n=1 Tax=Aspergillus glaucus CBS 516.65 TaxID=1160497 RepID=A0A1L9V550_ASPGL|nr:hypothetical protein ASPGLDRAFT_137739 [Aspergillus glaucus CBS 516.65]OJJ79026.1 hypothetical protein ASPGLDRAFT_137739 [Aspergillus glaucus CBS 516.65]